MQIDSGVLKMWWTIKIAASLFSAHTILDLRDVAYSADLHEPTTPAFRLEPGRGPEPETNHRQPDRRQTGGRAIAYSEREREFTFAKN